MGLDRGTTSGFRNHEGRLHVRTSSTMPRLYEALQTPMRCLTRGFRRCSVTRRYQWTGTPHHILLEGALPGRTELHDIRQGIPSDYPMSTRMATLYHWFTTPNDSLHRPSEPHIFPATPKVNKKTSAMGSRVDGIRPEAYAQERKRDDSGRRVVAAH
jgi:hypothetical protein